MGDPNGAPPAAHGAGLPPCLIGLLLLPLVLTWPFFPEGSSLGSPDGDAPKHLWTLWWTRTSLSLGEIPLVEPSLLVNWPYGTELLAMEPLHGLVAALLPG